MRQVLKQVFDATLKNSSFNLAESSKKWGHPWFHIYQHFTVSAFWARFQEWFSPLTAQAGVSRSIPGWIIRRQEIQPDKPTIGLQCTLNWSVCCLLVYKQSVQQRKKSKVIWVWGGKSFCFTSSEQLNCKVVCRC